MSRFYVTSPLEAGLVFQLSEAVSAYALRVLRLQRGDSLTLFNGDGYDYNATLLSANKRHAEVRVLSKHWVDCEATLHITLLQAISSAERMSFTLQKAVELGVRTIVPIASQRSVVKLTQERAQNRLQHWHNIITAACAQCGRASVPHLHPPTELAQWCLAHPLQPQIARLFLNPHSNNSLQQAVPTAPQQLILLVGAEGGLDEHEQQLANTHGFVSVRLGKRILRTETAALAALAAIQVLWGDLI